MESNTQTVPINLILSLSILSTLILHGNVPLIPDGFRVEVAILGYIFLTTIVVSNFTVAGAISAISPFIVMEMVDMIINSVPEDMKIPIYIATGTFLSVASLVATVILFKNKKYVYGIATLIALSGLVFFTISNIMIHIYSDVTLSPSSPGAPGAPGVSLSEREQCMQECGSDSVCFSACLDKCKFSYCVEYGRRVALNTSNCAEHQRKYEASGLSTAPGALLCREMHKHHGKCVVCDSNTCVEEKSCRTSLTQDLRSKLQSKESDYKNWHMTTDELQREWNKNKL